MSQRRYLGVTQQQGKVSEAVQLQSECVLRLALLSEVPPSFLLDSGVPKCQCCHSEMVNLQLQGAELFAGRLRGE